MTWELVCTRRLERHSLATPAPADRLADVVGAMCGAHAQVMSAAEVSVGIRVAGVTRTRVREALWADRTLVKTRGPRGTVHLLPAADLPMWTGALSALPAPAYESALLKPDQVDEVVDAVGEALAEPRAVSARAEPAHDGGADAAMASYALTTEELTAEVVARTGAWAGDRVVEMFGGEKWPRWTAAMAAASQRGAMCFGPERGRRTTYTSPARWLPGFTPMDTEAALSALVQRYLHGYGPALPAHFAKWLAISPKWAERLFASLDLERVDGGWVNAGDADLPESPADGVRLLPYFDAYAVGCHPRELVFPGRAGTRALARGQAGNFPVLLVDGTVAGVWHQRRSGRRIQVTVEPFGRLSAARRRALEEQVERVGEILEGTPTLTVGEVTAGPHA